MCQPDGSISTVPDGGAGAPGAPGAPTVSLPRGGNAVRGIGETFAANPALGTGAFTIPIPTSPGRSDFGPTLSLGYDSGSGNGVFCLGWSLMLPAVSRKTDKGLPRYRDAEESDVFVLSGAEDLVPVLGPNSCRHVEHRSGYTVYQYRPRVESLFARIERWSRGGDVHWRTTTRGNITTVYGDTDGSRIAAGDQVFSWLISQFWNDNGNAISYDCVPEDYTSAEPSQLVAGDGYDPHGNPRHPTTSPDTRPSPSPTTSRTAPAAATPPPRGASTPRPGRPTPARPGSRATTPETCSACRVGGSPAPKPSTCCRVMPTASSPTSTPGRSTRMPAEHRRPATGEQSRLRPRMQVISCL